MYMVRDEHEFVKSVIMPFLREHWDFIDKPEPAISKGDGRLTRDELTEAYERSLLDHRSVDSFILSELLMRYEPICRAYEDGYWFKDETVLGISEEDISVYEQIVDPSYRKRSGSRSQRLGSEFDTRDRSSRRKGQWL